MFTRGMKVALALVAVTVGIAAWRALPAASGPDGLGAGEVADIVALIHHDQQGIVLAHQAEAQSPTASTRDRADALAHSFQQQAATLTRALDVSRVPPRQRLIDTTRLAVADAGAVGCDLMPGDAVSRLAATAPAGFDARFSDLMGRHLVGGVAMAASVLSSEGLRGSERAGIRAEQERLS